MTTAETIYELVKKLPHEQLNLVMGFIQFLVKGEWTLSSSHISTERDQVPESLPWPEFVLSLSGVWADFPEIEEIRDGQGEDHREVL